jgi:hypothetical protein
MANQTKIIQTVSLLLVTLVFLGFVVEIYWPKARVRPWNRVSESSKQLLRQNNIVSPDESVEYFYSKGGLYSLQLYSMLGQGSVMTNKRVISFVQDEHGTIHKNWLPFDQIDSVNVVKEAGLWNDTIVQLTGVKEDFQPYELTLWLSGEEGGDKMFLETLHKNVGLKK